VIATDGDREGEVIGRELLDYFEWTGNINRLWLTALDDNSIKKALNSLKQGGDTFLRCVANFSTTALPPLLTLSTTLCAKSLLRQRPDCQYLPISQLSEVKDVMTAISNIDSNMDKLIVNADLTVQSKVWNDKKLSAHHAIIPTSMHLHCILQVALSA
jgi:DNA topoisomerase IA